MLTWPVVVAFFNWLILDLEQSFQEGFHPTALAFHDVCLFVVEFKLLAISYTGAEVNNFNTKNETKCLWTFVPWIWHISMTCSKLLLYLDDFCLDQCKCQETSDGSSNLKSTCCPTANATWRDMLATFSDFNENE